MLYHILPSTDLTETDLQAIAGTEPDPAATIAPESLESEGFVHCSYWHQLRAVAMAHFPQQRGMVVLELDSALVSDRVVEEDLYGVGESYPHLYGPIPVPAITGIMSLEWPDTGEPEFQRLCGPGGSEAMRDEGEISARIVARHAPPSPSDIDLLARLNAQLIADEGHDNPMSRDELARRMSNWLGGDYTAYIFESGSQVVGYALLDTRRGPAYLRQFFIQRGLRRTGLGRLTFRILQTHAGSAGMDVEVLWDNAPGRGFWNSLGFRPRSLALRLPSRLESDNTRQQRGDEEGVSPQGTEADTQPEVVVTIGDTFRQAEFVHEGLKRSNDQVSPYHRAARQPGAVTKIAVMLVAAGEWVGGITGSVFWNWLEVDDLWVRRDFRNRGNGSRLLDRMEEVARSRGAIRSRLTTFSFQARGLYEKHGYAVVGEMSDLPPGSSLYWMRKEL